MQLRFRSESGFGLMEFIVSAGLLGVVVLVARTQMIMNLKYNKQTDNRYELIEVGHEIQRRIDCNSVPKVCPIGEAVSNDIRDKKGRMFLKKNKTTVIRDWTVSAECGPQNMILIRGAKFKPDGTPALDPLTGEKLDWANNKGLIFAPGTLCPAKLAPDAAPGMLDVGVVAEPACVVDSQAKLPCFPVQPPDCNVGYYTTGITLDTFGGSNSGSNVFGQRWLRYCMQSGPK